MSPWDSPYSTLSIHIFKTCFYEKKWNGPQTSGQFLLKPSKASQIHQHQRNICRDAWPDLRSSFNPPHRENQTSTVARTFFVLILRGSQKKVLPDVAGHWFRVWIRLWLEINLKKSEFLELFWFVLFELFWVRFW